MTEFLIFLALCGGFAWLFARFLRRPTTDQRVKAQVARELAELRARVAAEDRAQGGFGRRESPIAERFVPGPGLLPLDQYDGAAPDMPFGRDLLRPDSRTIPAAFQGDWLWEAERDGPRHRLTIRADRLSYTPAIGMEPVVAVYLGGSDEMAVVTQQPDNGRWLYAEYTFGLLDGGTAITNLESTDMRWRRVTGQ